MVRATRIVKAMVMTKETPMVLSKETQAILEDGKGVPHIVRVTRTVRARAVTKKNNQSYKMGGGLASQSQSHEAYQAMESLPKSDRQS